MAVFRLSVQDYNYFPRNANSAVTHARGRYGEFLQNR